MLISESVVLWISWQGAKPAIDARSRQIVARSLFVKHEIEESFRQLQETIRMLIDHDLRFARSSTRESKTDKEEEENEEAEEDREEDRSEKTEEEEETEKKEEDKDGKGVVAEKEKSKHAEDEGEGGGNEEESEEKEKGGEEKSEKDEEKEGKQLLNCVIKEEEAFAKTEHEKEIGKLVAAHVLATKQSPALKTEPPPSPEPPDLVFLKKGDEPSWCSYVWRQLSKWEGISKVEQIRFIGKLGQVSDPAQNVLKSFSVQYKDMNNCLFIM